MFNRKVKTSIYFTDTRELISREVQEKSDLKGIEEQVSENLENLLSKNVNDGDCDKCMVGKLCKDVGWDKMGDA